MNQLPFDFAENLTTDSAWQIHTIWWRLAKRLGTSLRGGGFEQEETEKTKKTGSVFSVRSDVGQGPPCLPVHRWWFQEGRREPALRSLRGESVPVAQETVAN